MKRIEQKAIKFIDEKDLIQKDDRILTAFSGGADSVFLLRFLHKFGKRFGIKLGAFHLNHRIRGKEAEEDMRFCRETAAAYGIAFYSVSKNVRAYANKNKISVEEAGRKIRYAELEKARRKFGYDKIATAHNSSDNTETVLLNLVKGAGLSGISGIPERRGNIIRPVLVLTKDEIRDYLNEQGIAFRLDSSNLSEDYERNYIRKEIVPRIKDKLNPSLEDGIFNSASLFRNYAAYIAKRIDVAEKEIVKTGKEELKLFVPGLAIMESELAGDLLRSSLKINFSVQITFNDCKKVLSLLSKQPGTKVNLSGHLTAFKERDEILIFRGRKSGEFKQKIVKEGSPVEINGKELLIEKNTGVPSVFRINRSEEFISADGLKKDFLLRRWKDGDRFFPLGMKGSKKLSDFLNEQKISSNKKREQLILTNGGRIVWVLGLRIDDRFKLTRNTKKVYRLCLK